MRDYSLLKVSLRPGSDRQATMRAAVDALWEAFAAPTTTPTPSPTAPTQATRGPTPFVSWIGFYTKAADRDEMDLAVCRDKPACSPIALHGMCGRSWQTGRAVIVRDISKHSEDHIVCDPANQSELVVPLFEVDGSCWGVLDADSYEVDAFDERDAAEIGKLMEVLGLSAAGFAGSDCIVL